MIEQGYQHYFYHFTNLSYFKSLIEPTTAKTLAKQINLSQVNGF